MESDASWLAHEASFSDMSVGDWFQAGSLLLVTFVLILALVVTAIDTSVYLTHPKRLGKPLWVGVTFFMLMGVGGSIGLALGGAFLIEYLTLP